MTMFHQKKEIKDKGENNESSYKKIKKRPDNLAG